MPSRARSRGTTSTASPVAGSKIGVTWTNQGSRGSSGVVRAGLCCVPAEPVPGSAQPDLRHGALGRRSALGRVASCHMDRPLEQFVREHLGPVKIVARPKVLGPTQLVHVRDAEGQEWFAKRLTSSSQWRAESSAYGVWRDVP